MNHGTFGNFNGETLDYYRTTLLNFNVQSYSYFIKDTVDESRVWDRIKEQEPALPEIYDSVKINRHIDLTNTYWARDICFNNGSVRAHYGKYVNETIVNDMLEI